MLGDLGVEIEIDNMAVPNASPADSPFIKQCHEALAADCNRVFCTVKMDYRKDHPNMLESKIASVEKQLGRKLKT